jgi:Ulp1 family protease
MVFVPIHKDQHWSLAVVTNAGLLDFCTEENEPSEIPCIMHMDGLSLHDRKGIAANIRIWLNAEWKKKKNINVNIFTVLTMDSFSVPGKPSFCSTHVH